MAKRWFHELVNAYEGRPFVIVGGGPSVAEHLEEWPEDAIVVGANEHGLKAWVRHHFIVAIDPIYESKIKPLRDELDPELRPDVIAEPGWATVQLGHHWRCGNSGVLAAWCAHIMGGVPVILTGMDLYTDGTYFWDTDAHSDGTGWGTNYQVLKWKELRDVQCPGIECRVLGDGPLCQVFPQYDPEELVERSDHYRAPEVLEMRGQLVKFHRNKLVRGIPYSVGDEAFLSPEDARDLLAMKAIELIPEDDEGRTAA